MAKLRDFLGMIRFSHTLFAMPFAVASALLAWRTEPFRWLDLLGILLCMVFARSTAMAFNRLADRRIDAINPRTAGRHLPSGKLSVTAVVAFTLVCALGFVAATLVFAWSNGNWWPAYLSLPVLGFVCAYSLTKRFTSLSHFWLGASLMLAPVATWLAITGSMAWTPVILGFVVLFWVAGFDILYACQDVDFDKKTGLNSIPARLGVQNSLRVAMLCHVGMVGWLIALWWVAGLGPIFLAGVVGVALLLAYEHWLVKPDDLTRVNLAFFHVNTVISLGLLALVGLDLLLGA